MKRNQQGWEDVGYLIAEDDDRNGNLPLEVGDEDESDIIAEVASVDEAGDEFARLNPKARDQAIDWILSGYRKYHARARTDGGFSRAGGW